MKVVSGHLYNERLRGCADVSRTTSLGIERRVGAHRDGIGSRQECGNRGRRGCGPGHVWHIERRLPADRDLVAAPGAIDSLFVVGRPSYRDLVGRWPATAFAAAA